MLGIKPIPSLSMHCDCQAVIAIARNITFNGKYRHNHLRHDIVIATKRWNYFHSLYKVKRELADPLTKPLGRKLIYETSRGMELMAILKNQQW